MTFYNGGNTLWLVKEKVKKRNLAKAKADARVNNQYLPMKSKKYGDRP